MTQSYKKKLIEVAIPLEAINAASAREKSIRHGHPSTLHLWWARRPLAACRAVLFAQLVDDPSSHPDKFPTEEAIEAERKRLFNIIEELVKWENSANEEVLGRAQKEILNSCEGYLPPIHDPFSGGGSIPLEAQRLGLPANGSDLNPVAVLIGKSMLEYPRIFKDHDPINPGMRTNNHYRNSQGLAEDVQYYGDWLKREAFKSIGKNYPKVCGGQSKIQDGNIPIAWIWARTVPSPDPAFSHLAVPLVSTFALDTRSKIYLSPTVDRQNETITFELGDSTNASAFEKSKSGTKNGRGANFNCLFSGSAITPEHVKNCGKNGRLGHMLLAVVAEGKSGKIYCSADEEQINSAAVNRPNVINSINLPNHSQYIGVLGYGFSTFEDLYTDRQLAALTTLSMMISKVKDKVIKDAQDAGLNDIDISKYADTICVYLAFCVTKLADRGSTNCTWDSSRASLGHTFGRQAISMTWDFAEANPFSNSTGSWDNSLNWIVKVLQQFVPNSEGTVVQSDARDVKYAENTVISSDPPYYDNIPYADLSDYFFQWLKSSLGVIMPNAFNFLATPKMDELVADRVRHGSASAADQYFLAGMIETFVNCREQASENFPMSIYYAFKQSEVSQEGISSTGWATFLEAIVSAGYSVVGTWPIRTELANRLRGIKFNALANSVVLVCRIRRADAGVATRSEFIRELQQNLPAAIRQLQSANVSPADIPQSAIGPGMGIFSQYKYILEADDSPMSVKTALQLINAELDEFLNDFQGDFDPETRFTASWFEQNGYAKGDFGSANSLATARGIAVDGVKHAGIIESSAGKVRILKRDELDADWDPNSDTHLTIWECCQYLVKEYENGGETVAAMLVKKMGFEKAESVKDLAYYLYDICSNKRQDAKEATSYNALIAGWADITRLAASIHDTDTTRQASLF